MREPLHQVRSFALRLAPWRENFRLVACSNAAAADGPAGSNEPGSKARKRLANGNLNGLLDHLADLDLHLLLDRVRHPDGAGHGPLDLPQLAGGDLLVAGLGLRFANDARDLAGPLLELALGDRAGPRPRLAMVLADLMRAGADLALVDGRP